MEKESKILDKALEKMLNIFFSKDKTKLYVILIFILGFILRLINLLNAPTTIDASGHALMAYDFIYSDKLATWNQSVGLWYFLTDLFYKIFGINDIGARFAVLLFGSLSIIVMFLFVKEFFGKKAGLVAAFLLAVSPFHITETIPEMDVTTMFFVLLAMLFFVRALKQNKKLPFILAGAFIGAAVLIKIYSALFIPALLLYAVYYGIKHKPEKKPFRKNILIFIAVASIFCLVPLAYNYLLYQDKGFVDYIFTNILGIGKEKSNEYYSWVVPYEHDYMNFFFPGKNSAIPFFILYFKVIGGADILAILLGIIGLLLILLSKKKDYSILLLCSFFTVYLYMGSMIFLMTKHYIFLLILIIPLASLVVEKITEKVKVKHILAILLVAIFIFQMFWLLHYTDGKFFEKSSMNELVSYKESISENALVVWDSRIFRGIGTYVFMDKHYLEANYFSKLMNSQEQISGSYQPTETYFIECASDDCGWGNVKDQPEFNQSTEQIVDFFKANSELVESIEGTGGLSYSYNIYKGTFQLKQGTLAAADSSHIFWVNPVGYDENIAPIFDDYETHNIWEEAIDKIAHFIFYLSVFIAILSIFIVVYIFIKDNSEKD
ncbi:MAG: glycosyltransferase family 39 protein [Candidatus Nanoarchaeia archaeon]|nr:glycosyltransferase family 39 protein [Candidatus Nanoarchaeia archaeon]MDD5358163.1 glycosyltransferase family 39 protein [Candidatus Nanoarchaeia archaeon]MDD5589350.1 glycosyltransferase family 39 protein [Candidatus Nanoarchaeia archaeon]